ncbi:MAG: Asp-tRNA(Asn)/Glu-tRNA(Gln) amidotransferase GatCAB subunit B, partial [Gemmatimonadetes bacterium]|nr:Asp-tRNA(Asn)/Glu-tRNA(Gln) amidotransferase GatCAB subunit B [Gemmatimonadota bacterium]NNL30309.1 Asp-tRNA(Asn)/Glu-tRNA(Gln) amidotransferase GatCAB subunit B [Gemmatimonadota bacterium]
LSAYDAHVLTQSAAGADYFEAAAESVDDAKQAANWVMGPAQALMNARGEDPSDFAVSAASLAEIVNLVRDGTISDSAGKRVLEGVAAGEGVPLEIVEREGLEQVRDDTALLEWIGEVMNEFPDEVERYRGGESRLLGFLVGRVMQRSRGSADPRRVNELLRERTG